MNIDEMPAGRKDKMPTGLKIYRVFFNTTDVASPIELQAWLNRLYGEGLELVSWAGDYFIFKQRSV